VAPRIKPQNISASQGTGPEPWLTCGNILLRCVCTSQEGSGERHQKLILTCGYTLLRWSVHISGTGGRPPSSQALLAEAEGIVSRGGTIY